MERELWATQVEYSSAASSWLSDAVDVISRELHPILNSVKREPIADLTRSDQHAPESADLASPLYRGIEVSHVVTASIQDAINGSVEPFLTMVFVLADEFGGQLTAGMFAHLSDVCDASGQSIDATGRDFIEVMIETLESIDMSFDENGNPNLTMVLHPDTAEKLRDKRPTPEQEARIREIYDRKREEWNASRRRQDLP